MLKYIFLFSFISFVYSSNVFCQSKSTLEQLFAAMDYQSQQGLPFNKADKRLNAFLQKYIVYKNVKLDTINTKVFRVYDKASKDTVFMGVIKYTMFIEEVNKVDDCWEYFLYSSKNSEFHKIGGRQYYKIDGIKPEAKLEVVLIYGMDGFQKYWFHNSLADPKSYHISKYYIKNNKAMAKDGGFSPRGMETKATNKKLSLNTLSEYLDLIKKFKKELAKSKIIRRMDMDIDKCFLEKRY